MVTRISATRRNYQIVGVFEVWRRHNVLSGQGDVRTDLSMRQVAFWLKMRPSTYLKRKLDEAVVAGWLERSEYQYRKNVKAHLYRITDNGIELLAHLSPYTAHLL